MRGRMGSMATSERIDLLDTLAANFQEVTRATARIMGENSDDERQYIRATIVRLRRVRRELEAKLKSLKNSPPLNALIGQCGCVENLGA